jgi:sulfur-oxidizing protein SoxY
MEQSCSALSRRSMLIAVGAAAAALVMAPRLTMAKPEQVEAELKKLYGDKPRTEGKIKLELPSIAENGQVVPLKFEVESQMTENDYVKAVHIFADGNPNPGVASFYFTPLMPKAAAQFRIRLAGTQNVVAVAEMADGTLHSAKQEVKVTIGGCGG